LILKDNFSSLKHTKFNKTLCITNKNSFHMFKWIIVRGKRKPLTLWISESRVQNRAKQCTSRAALLLTARVQALMYPVNVLPN